MRKCGNRVNYGDYSIMCGEEHLGHTTTCRGCVDELLKEAVHLLNLSAASTSIWQRRKQFMSHPKIVEISMENRND